MDPKQELGGRGVLSSSGEEGIFNGEVFIPVEGSNVPFKGRGGGLFRGDHTGRRGFHCFLNMGYQG